MRFASASSNEPYKPSMVERLVESYLLELFRLAAADEVVSLCGCQLCPGALSGLAVLLTHSTQLQSLTEYT